MNTPTKPQRKNPRLREYDYASPGMYFVTICTHRRSMLFGSIIDGVIIPTRFGEYASEAIASIPVHFPSAQPDHYVVMPNHVHMIIRIGEQSDTAYTLGQIIGGFKSTVTRVCKTPIWQRGYHEHVIRNNKDLEEIRTYIHNNPANWAQDCHNPDNEKYGLWTEPDTGDKQAGEA